MASIEVSNASQLAAALQVAKGGDVIRLASGDYGAVTISSKSFLSDVTIISADAGHPATFASLLVRSSANINFVGINVDFTPTATTTSATSAVMIDKSMGISISGGEITGGPAVSGVLATATTLDSTGNVIGLPTGRAVTIQNSADVNIDHTDISVFLRGVVVSSSDKVTIRDNEIHDLRKTAIVGGGNNLVIEGNHLHSAHPWGWGLSGGDHADFIALWTNSTQASATTNVTIRDNLLEQGSGVPVLGMWLQGGEATFKNVIIENNAILGGDHQGIMMSDVIGGRVAHNVLLQTTAARDAPGILMLNGATNIDVSANLAWFVQDRNAGATGNLLHDNALVQNTSATTAGYYDATLVSQVLDLTDAADIYNAAALGVGATTAVATMTETATATITAAVTTTTTGVTLTGTSSANLLTGGAGADIFDGRGGYDTLVGGAGNDTYYLPNSQTTIIEKAGEGVDTVIAKGDYTLGADLENLTINNTVTNGWAGVGNSLNNILTGNAGANRLEGMGGNDTIRGGDGGDVIVGGVGNDVLTGGAGADTFRFAPGSGKDVITDFGYGPDRDTLDVSAFFKAGFKATLADSGGNVIISFSNGDAITIQGVHAADLVSSSGVGWVF